jgi:organic radical activating enzyme
MTSIISRLFPKEVEPLKPGIYHYVAAEDSPIPYRLHLRIEKDGTGILIVNAATVLHLNSTATAHALQLVQGAKSSEAAKVIAQRYRVGLGQAYNDFEVLKQKIITIATNPDVDPVLYMGLEREDPYESSPAAPYRLDIALTYTTNPDGELDPLARERVDRELNTAEWKDILRKAWDAGIPHVTFTGGEPTRRDDLVELITFAEELGQVTGVLTDGRRLSSKEYVEALSQAGLDHFLITLVPEDEDSVQGLENAIESDVFTALHLTLTEDFVPKVEKWLTDFKEMDLQAVSISSIDTSQDMVQAISDARDMAADLGLELVWNIPVPYSQNNPIAIEVTEASSGAGRAWLYIEPDGDVLPEQGVNKILGNLSREAWDEIWERAKETEMS